MTAAPLSLFQGFGIEIEYMIVDVAELDVLPIADRVLRTQTGEIVMELERGPIAWSNELVLHLLELKTNGPAPRLPGVAAQFQASIGDVNALLAPLGARLMPTGAHPWMDPHRQMRLWPHEDNAIYAALNRIFDCRGHGWANLQSTHINLPFADDEEFAALHDAIRIVLPLIPALAASTPVLDGRWTGLLDTRLEHYRVNARRIPSVTGQVVPESVASRARYESQILDPLYRDIAPYDTEGILQYEWLNARGAIARFDRMAIEIRVTDAQEYPAADLAIAGAVSAVLKALIENHWTAAGPRRDMSTERLARLFRATSRHAERARIDDAEYLALFGCRKAAMSAASLWHLLCEQTDGLDAFLDADTTRALEVILHKGPLARRIIDAVGEQCRLEDLRACYRVLCDCLAQGRPFVGLT